MLSVLISLFFAAALASSSSMSKTELYWHALSIAQVQGFAKQASTRYQRKAAVWHQNRSQLHKLLRALDKEFPRYIHGCEDAKGKASTEFVNPKYNYPEPTEEDVNACIDVVNAALEEATNDIHMKLQTLNEMTSSSVSSESSASSASNGNAQQ